MATLIKSDGSQYDYPNFVGYEAKQEAVGGYFEPVYLDGKVLIVNEEGLITDLPLNETASLMAMQTIVGDVLLLSREEWESDNK